MTPCPLSSPGRGGCSAGAPRNDQRARDMTRLLVSEVRRHDHTAAPPLPASRAGWLVGARWQQPPTVPGGGDTHAPDGDDRVDRAKPPRAFRVHPPFPMAGHPYGWAFG